MSDSDSSDSSMSSDSSNKSNYYDIILKQKNEILNSMSKEDMVDLIFKQNSLIVQQSNQLIDLANLLNSDYDKNSESENNKDVNEVNYNITFEKLHNEYELLQIFLLIIFAVVLFIMLINNMYKSKN